MVRRPCLLPFILLGSLASSAGAQAPPSSPEELDARIDRIERLLERQIAATDALGLSAEERASREETERYSQQRLAQALERLEEAERKLPDVRAKVGLCQEELEAWKQRVADYASRPVD